MYLIIKVSRALQFKSDTSHWVPRNDKTQFIIYIIIFYYLFYSLFTMTLTYVFTYGSSLAKVKVDLQKIKIKWFQAGEHKQTDKGMLPPAKWMMKIRQPT